MLRPFIASPLLRRRKQNYRPYSHGFTLIEVLVAIVIFSFGLLGMVGMQAFALQANREARLQNQATTLARELAEMMRSNRQIAVKATATDNPYLGAFSTGSLSISSPSYCLSVSNASTGCSSTTDVAAAQMSDWLARVDASLPSARVSVCLDGTPYTSDGLAQWSCTATGASEIIYIKIGWTQSSTNRTLTGNSAFEQASDTNSRPGIIFPVTSGSAS
ncbi:type IV pilus modification protein PilV [Comamonas sp. Y33R10-2]|uniref:type IV pilus modification protein PilV n=1 Tax=Comamonas sp. Y33R10-2 TaxID=2853257 RepID=UPI001C5C8E67|nr:type IV pilus modification protein PilV [Comamonas sp. Y33R10-2]QXZ10156.1 type IV pilus modification protein PilV [Comamonas sp. Y33R10-2]